MTSKIDWMKLNTDGRDFYSGDAQGVAGCFSILPMPRAGWWVLYLSGFSSDEWGFVRHTAENFDTPEAAKRYCREIAGDRRVVLTRAEADAIRSGTGAFQLLGDYAGKLGGPSGNAGNFSRRAAV